MSEVPQTITITLTACGQRSYKAHLTGWSLHPVEGYHSRWSLDMEDLASRDGSAAEVLGALSAALAVRLGAGYGAG